MTEAKNTEGNQTIDDLHPVVLVVQRDPNVIGRERLEQVAHDWNKTLDHVDSHLIKKVVDTPVPFGMVDRINPENDDFYSPGEVMVCSTCFGEDEQP